MPEFIGGTRLAVFADNEAAEKFAEVCRSLGQTKAQVSMLNGHMMTSSTAPVVWVSDDTRAALAKAKGGAA
jgi:hypothetical protein